MADTTKKGLNAYDMRSILKPDQKEISTKAYYGIMGAIIAYGFAINAVLVLLFQNYIRQMSYSAWSGFTKNYGTITLAILIGYLFCSFIGSRLLNSNRAGISFIGFHFLAIPIGIVLAVAVLPYYPMSIIIKAMIMTAILTVSMVIVAIIMPDAYLNMGKTLCTSASLCIIIDLIAVFIFRTDLTIIDFALTIIFALFIGYDWARASRCARTLDNAVDCAALLYLNIINLFLRVLSVLGKKSK